LQVFIYGRLGVYNFSQPLQYFSYHLNITLWLYAQAILFYNKFCSHMMSENNLIIFIQDGDHTHDVACSINDKQQVMMFIIIQYYYDL